MTMKASARIPTKQASLYLQKLCKHWSHKFDVSFTPLEGRVPFGPDRACDLEADDEALVLTVEGPDAEACETLGGVVYDHLARFASKEELPAPVWAPA